MYESTFCATLKLTLGPEDERRNSAGFNWGFQVAFKCVKQPMATLAQGPKILFIPLARCPCFAGKVNFSNDTSIIDQFCFGFAFEKKVCGFHPKQSKVEDLFLEIEAKGTSKETGL